MQSRAGFAGQQRAIAPARKVASAAPGEQLSSLLGAGQFLEAVIEHIPAVVFVKDAKDFRFILLNRAGEQFLGVSRQAIIGKTDHDVFPKEEADQFVARDREVLKSREVAVMDEEPVHTPHNGLRFLRTRLIVICDEKQEPEFSSAFPRTSPTRSTRPSASGTWRITTVSPTSPIVPCSASASTPPWPSIAARGAAWCFTSSISTGSSGSTTRSAIRPATPCCASWPNVCAAAARRGTPWRGSAATNSRCCIRSRPPARV